MNNKIEKQKNIIICKLKEKGYKITRQRLLIIDILLENECSCCKEIYYQVSKIDKNIGKATIYRFITTLEEIEAINRKNMYKISYLENYTTENSCIITYSPKSNIL